MMRLLFALCVVLCALAIPDLGAAHAQLRGAVPAEAAVLDAAPDQVTLRFNEPVSPLVLRWIAPDGATVDVAGRAQGVSVAVTPPAGLAEGTHLLSWRVMSADGHPVGGALTFHIGAASQSAPGVAVTATGAARAAVVLRFGLTLALVGAVGVAVFAVLVIRGPLQAAAAQVLRINALLCLPLGLGLIGVQGLDLLSLPPAAILRLPPWQAALAAPVAVTVGLVLLAAMLALAVGAMPRGKLRVVCALLALALAALSFVVSGHAATAQPRAIAVAAVFWHAVALVFWMGALVPLLLVFGTARAPLLLRRFSALAVPAVVVLVLSGATLTWLQAGSWQALTGAAYGQVLGAKLVLVIALLGLAARNRFVLTPALAAADSAAPQRLARAVRMEILLGLVILALAATFRLTPPPRALVAVAEPLYMHIHDIAAMADITVTPGRAGPVMITLGLQRGDFSALAPQEVEATFAMEDAGIEPIRVAAFQGDDGLWYAGPVALSRPGAWDLTLRLLVSDFERVTLTETLILRP